MDNDSLTTTQSRVANWHEQLFNNVHTGVLIVDDNRIILEANQTFFDLFGYVQRSELLGQTTKKLHISDESYLRFGELIVSKALLNEPLSLRFQLKRKDGSFFWVKILGQPGQSGQQNSSVWTFIDINEQVIAERALQESEQKFRILADHTFDWESWRNPQGEHIYMSPSCERITGYTPAEFNSNPQLFFDLIPPGYRETVQRHYLEDNSGIIPPHVMEFPIIMRTGEERWIEHNCRAIFDGQGNYAGRRSNNRDITDRKKSIELLVREKQTAQTYLDIAGVMFCAIDRDGKITLINKKGCQLLGYKEVELIGKNWFEICLPEDAVEAVKGVFAQHLTGNIEMVEFYENEIITRGGEKRVIAFHNTLLHDDDRISGVLFSGEDITDRKKSEEQHLELEAQLRQKYKMEAVGVMAGGIAHNFNNNLAIILGNLEMTDLKKENPDQVEKYLKNAKIAVQRARDLIGQIMAYSRKGTQRQVPSQLKLILDETVTLLSSTIPSTVQLTQSIGSNSNHMISANASQVQEVLLNLCNNAVHAIEEQGSLSLTLEFIELEQKAIPVCYSCEPGPYLHLSVQDSGCGISAENLEKIFDPFFTTKEIHEGTGMGLPTVQGIIEQHNGMITVESAVGKGSTFHLYFPIVEQPYELLPSQEDRLHRRGEEKILFVDDEEMLANLCKEMLSEMGYQVTTITDSREALELFTANSHHFDLVISDQTMPELTGEELITKIKGLRPEIPTILCTGYSSKVDEKEAQQQGISAFLQKPIDFPELLRVISNVLGRESGGGRNSIAKIATTPFSTNF